ncbi:PQQ-dependent sugar dehydrogenase [Psychrobacter sp. Marseille-P5312]|uniref:PQQ-dependent sugar dehydrogenase n=1 Tax=Psychrobacter sp. Marseille-P5312 TaxID=2086574 RepID=UPI0022285CED|nr:PQQ-dependent sugar dehydrogenase [Psychrobacter sp. Marseille-P5312]
MNAMPIDSKMSKNKKVSLPLMVAALLFSTAACSESATPVANTQDVDISTSEQTEDSKPSFTTQVIATFNEPWAMTALPTADNESPKLLVTQKTGELFVVDTATGSKTAVAGIPAVAYGGQGGLGDVILAPDFSTSKQIYLSYAEAGTGGNSGKFGAKVIKAALTGLDTETPSLQALMPIWEQAPKVRGQGHYSHRLLFSPDGQYLYISSGDRQQKAPAQDMSGNLGKIIRLHPDGSVPKDNPFTEDKHEIAKQFWSIGHRNVLGMVFDDAGRLWAHEMGPRGGDEFNLIKKGRNYGWPVVSNGRNYNGTDIPDHDTRPDFAAPHITWTPVISPSSMSIYASGRHNDFPAWQGYALISGLSSQALMVVRLDSNNGSEKAGERYRYDMGERMRSVLAVDGRVWLLEDGKDAKLLQLVRRQPL